MQLHQSGLASGPGWEFIIDPFMLASRPHVQTGNKNSQGGGRNTKTGIIKWALFCCHGCSGFIKFHYLPTFQVQTSRFVRLLTWSDQEQGGRVKFVEICFDDNTLSEFDADSLYSNQDTGNLFVLFYIVCENVRDGNAKFSLLLSFYSPACYFIRTFLQKRGKK